MPLKAEVMPLKAGAREQASSPAGHQIASRCAGAMYKYVSFGTSGFVGDAAGHSVVTAAPPRRRAARPLPHGFRSFVRPAVDPWSADYRGA